MMRPHINYVTTYYLPSFPTKKWCFWSLVYPGKALECFLLHHFDGLVKDEKDFELNDLITKLSRKGQIFQRWVIQYIYILL